MTYMKSTSIALALSALLGASAACAGDAPTFADIDANADGQVNITEFTAAPGMDAFTTSEITSKFYDISDGSETFTESDYEVTLMPSEDSTTVTPENPSNVLGAVETNEDYDAGIEIETTDDLELDTDIAAPDESYEPEATEPDVVNPESDINPDTTLDSDLNTNLDATVETNEEPEL